MKLSRRTSLENIGLWYYERYVRAENKKVEVDITIERWFLSVYLKSPRRDYIWCCWQHSSQ